MDNYKVNYRLNFCEKDKGKPCRIDILKRGYSGAILPFIGGSEPMIISFKNEDDNKFNQITGSQSTVSLSTSESLSLDNFYTEDEREFLVKLYIDSNLEWAGFVTPDSAGEPFLTPPYEALIKATDLLGALKKVAYTTAGGVPIRKVDNVKNILLDCLNKTGLELDLVIGVNTYEDSFLKGNNDCPLEQTYIDTNRFIDTNNKAYSCFEIIKSLCSEFTANIKQVEGKWWLVDRDELRKPSYRVRVFDYKGQKLENKLISKRKKAGHKLLPEIGFGAPLELINKDHYKTNIPGYKSVTTYYQFGYLSSALKNGDLNEIKLEPSLCPFVGWNSRGEMKIDVGEKTAIIDNTGIRKPNGDRYAIITQPRAIDESKGMASDPISILATNNTNITVGVGRPMDSGWCRLYFLVELSAPGKSNLFWDWGNKKWVDSYISIPQDVGGLNPSSEVAVNIQMTPPPHGGTIVFSILGGTPVLAPDGPFFFNNISIQFEQNSANKAPIGFVAVSNQIGNYSESPEPIVLFFGDDSETQRTSWMRNAVGVPTRTWAGGKVLQRVIANKILTQYQKTSRLFEGTFKGGASPLDVIQIDKTGGSFYFLSGEFQIKSGHAKLSLVELFIEDLTPIDDQTSFYDYGDFKDGKGTSVGSSSGINIPPLIPPTGSNSYIKNQKELQPGAEFNIAKGEADELKAENFTGGSIDVAGSITAKGRGQFETLLNIKSKIATGAAYIEFLHADDTRLSTIGHGSSTNNELYYNIPSNNSHRFVANAIEKFTINPGYIQSNGLLRITRSDVAAQYTQIDHEAGATTFLAKNGSSAGFSQMLFSQGNNSTDREMARFASNGWLLLGTQTVGLGVGALTVNGTAVIGHETLGVNSNQTKLFIRNVLGKHWALSAGLNSNNENDFGLYNWSDLQGTPLFVIGGASGNATVNSRIGGGIMVLRNNAGAVGNNYINFLNNTGARLGYVGYGSASNNNFQLQNDLGANQYGATLHTFNGGVVANSTLIALQIGVSNSIQTSGNGISLYNGATVGQPNYGFMFAGTATFGVHGAVTGDWATYLTMSGDNARGWIFKNATSGIGVASVSSSGIASFNGRISTADHLKTTSAVGLIGNYDNNNGGGDQIIWSIGSQWATLATHYGIGYDYNKQTGVPNVFGHSIFFAELGAKKARLSLTRGDLWLNGSAFLGGIQSNNFVQGDFAGTGFRIDSDGNAEVDSLTVRKELKVTTLNIREIIGTGGAFAVTNTAEIDSVTETATAWRCKIGSTLALQLRSNDVIRCQVWDGVGVKYYSGIVGATGFEAGQAYFDITKASKIGTGIPAPKDKIWQFGNVTDTARQGVVYLTNSDPNAPYIDVMDGITTDNWANKTKVRMGQLKGITSPVWGAISGYGLFGQNVYLENAFFSGSVNVTGGNAETITGSQTKANTAQTSAISAASANTDSKINLFKGTLGDLAYENLVEKAKLGATVISGGFILTSLIKANEVIVSGGGATTVQAQNMANTAETNAKAYADQVSKTNLINNPQVTKSTTGWAGTAAAISVKDVDFFGTQIKALSSLNPGNNMIISSRFNVDPAKCYEVTIWMKAESLPSNKYFGVYTYDSSGVAVNAIPVNATTGAEGTPSNNLYFFNTPNALTNWYKVTAYVLPAGFTSASSANAGINNAINIKMLPNTGQLLIRWLNYDAGVSAKEMLVANPSVIEVSPQQISRLSSIQSSLGGLAYEDIVEKARLGDTVISGGFIRTELIQASQVVVNGGGATTTQAQGYANTAQTNAVNSSTANLNAFKGTLGSLAYDNIVEKAKLGTTIITGGFIRSELIQASQIVVDGGGATLSQAQGYANTAEANAKTASATDATTKANTAQTNAIATSGTNADSKINTFKGTLGTLAYDSFVEKAKLGTTVISGGFILTSLIKANEVIVQGGGATTTQAQGYASAAETNAKIAAAADATTKANAAQTGAVTTAGTNTDTKINTFKSTLGSLAYDNLVEKAKLGTTVIQGGFILTSLLRAEEIQALTVTAASINAIAIDASSIKTGKLKADRIDVEDLVVRNLKTADSGQRVEINRSGNRINFFAEGAVTPNVTIDATVSTGAGSAVSAGMRVYDPAAGSSFITAAGIFSNAGLSSPFSVASGLNISGSIVGINFTNTTVATAVRASIIGVDTTAPNQVGTTRAALFMGEVEIRTSNVNVGNVKPANLIVEGNVTAQGYIRGVGGIGGRSETMQANSSAAINSDSATFVAVTSTFGSSAGVTMAGANNGQLVTVVNASGNPINIRAGATVIGFTGTLNSGESITGCYSVDNARWIVAKM